MFHEANDPFELKLLDTRNKKLRIFSEVITSYYEQNVGMVCFSEDWRSPMMWAHYADKHKGVCLGIDVNDETINVVNYTDEKIAIPTGEKPPLYGLNADMLNKMVLTKATCWRYERERRVLAPLKNKDPDTGYYYTEFRNDIKLKSVMLGHRCDWTTGEARRAVGEVTSPVRILKVRPAFGKFEMVEQHDFQSITIRPKKKA